MDARSERARPRSAEHGRGRMPINARGLVVILNGEVVQDDGDVVRTMRDETVALTQFVESQEAAVHSLMAAWQTAQSQLRTALLAYQTKLDQLLTPSHVVVNPADVALLASVIHDNTQRIRNLVPPSGAEEVEHG